MRTASWFTVSTALMAVVLALGCGKKEDKPIEVPSASASVATPEPPPPAPSSADTPKPPPVVVSNTGGEAAVKACCNALRGEAKSASAKDKSAYESAASVCDSQAAAVKAGKAAPDAAKRVIRAQIQRTGKIPGACN